MKRKIIRKTLFQFAVILLSAFILGVYSAADVSTVDSSQQSVCVYLTFDDGPSANTEKILDVLAEYEVPAAFFVSGQYPEYFPLLSRAAAEGHYVAAHTYSHVFSEIYASSEAFWADQERILDLIFLYTAEQPRLLRFAGGSSNTVSYSYGGRGLMRELIKQAESSGLDYVDWNVDASDSLGHDSVQSVIARVVSGVGDVSGRSAVVLMHDTPSAPSTPQALAQIITQLRERGYVFARIDEMPDECHQTL